MVQPPSMCSAILAFGRSFYISWAGKRFPLPRNRKFWRGRPVLCNGRSPRVLGERQVTLKVQRNEASSETVFDARSSAQAAVRGESGFRKRFLRLLLLPERGLVKSFLPIAPRPSSHGQRLQIVIASCTKVRRKRYAKEPSRGQRTVESDHEGSGQACRRVPCHRFACPQQNALHCRRNRAARSRSCRADEVLQECPCATARHGAKRPVRAGDFGDRQSLFPGTDPWFPGCRVGSRI